MTEQEKKIEFLRNRLKEKFENMSVPMNQIEYTRENYDKLFPNSEVTTPKGIVKLGGHQFEKLEKGRKHLLGAMHQTLTDPIAIINQEDKRGKANLYSKSFNDKKKTKGVQSVVVDIGGTNVSISTHPRDIKNIVNKIKKATDLIYEKPDNSRTAGNDSKNLADKGDTQLINNIPQTEAKVNRINDRISWVGHPVGRY